MSWVCLYVHNRKNIYLFFMEELVLNAITNPYTISLRTLRYQNKKLLSMIYIFKMQKTKMYGTFTTLL